MAGEIEATKKEDENKAKREMYVSRISIRVKSRHD
jgi:hypothetical protein